MSYCFLCLFRADKAASGLAFRIPQLWKALADSGEDVYLIINQSLFDKTLSNNISLNIKKKVYIIPDIIDFKIDSLFLVPPILLYLVTIKKITKFHLTIGGAYFIKYIKLLSKISSEEIQIHTSIGSKNLEMLVGNDFNSKYYQLHENLLRDSYKIDCLYPTSGFPEFQNKCIQSPGSFSWKYDTTSIENLIFNKNKNYNILFCSTLIPQKNYRLAIDGYKKLVSIPDIKELDEIPKLVIVAPSIPDKLMTEIQLFNKGEVGHILLEKYENIDKLLKDSYIFLSLQDYDNYPSQSLIEAMAHGCSVIATNFGDTSKIVKVNYNNYLIEKDVSELVDAMIKLLFKKPFINYDNINYILNNHTVQQYAEYFKNNFIRNEAYNS
ncbi:glycosyltransferase [Psychrobacter lutiphocae]|uniref:glycosyltransferase n=1 Tax=Psychrobacter lutiphocae TaxID=540500 RepID=UPI000360285F|nr:glycosyltransferase [Psychrobacter lutiphocae]